MPTDIATILPDLPEDELARFYRLKDRTIRSQGEILSQLLLLNALLPKKRMADWLNSASKEVADQAFREHLLKIALGWQMKE